MKGFASILKSRLEDAVDTWEDIYGILRDLVDTPIQDLLHEIGRLQNLEDLRKHIKPLIW